MQVGPTSADTGPNYVGGADVTTDDVRAILDPMTDSPETPTITSNTTIITTAPTSYTREPTKDVGGDVMSVVFLICIMMLFCSQLCFYQWERMTYTCFSYSTLCETVSPHSPIHVQATSSVKVAGVHPSPVSPIYTTLVVTYAIFSAFFSHAAVRAEVLSVRLMSCAAPQ